MLTVLSVHQLHYEFEAGTLAKEVSRLAASMAGDGRELAGVA